MASGMEMMMKTLGFDPEIIKSQAGQIGAMLQQFQKTLDRIETKVDILQSEMAALKSHDAYDPTPDEPDILPRTVLLTPHE